MLYRLDRPARPREGSARLEIDLDVIASNYGKILAQVSPSRVMAVVKDNAYGHGLQPVAARLYREGCRDFGVATLIEAALLEESGIPPGSVLILRSLTSSELPLAVSRGFALTVASPDHLLAVDAVASRLCRSIDVHLKVDTGLGRLGFLPGQTAGMISAMERLSAARICGVYSHFAMTLKRHPHNDAQLERFIHVCTMLDARLPGLTRHIAATAATLGMPESRLDMVRLGGLLFGLTSVGELPWGLRKPLAFKAPLVQVKTVPPGWNVGYRLMFRAPDRMKVGVIAAGAGDGYPYALRFKADVLVRGIRCRVVGMGLDQCMIDLTNVSTAQEGEDTVLIGECNGATLNAEQLAEAAGTTFGELLSRISSRIPRLYLENGFVASIESPTEVRELVTC